MLTARAPPPTVYSALQVRPPRPHSGRCRRPSWRTQDATGRRRLAQEAHPAATWVETTVLPSPRHRLLPAAGGSIGGDVAAARRHSHVGVISARSASRSPAAGSQLKRSKSFLTSCRAIAELLALTSSPVTTWVLE